MGGVIAEVTAGLHQRLAGAADLGRAAGALLPYTGVQQHRLRFELDAARMGVNPSNALPGSLASEADVAAAVTALKRLAALEKAAGDVLVAATHPVAEAWQSVTDARKLAAIMRRLTPHSGEPGQRDDLGAAAAAAVGRLHQLLPDWWPRREAWRAVETSAGAAAPTADVLRAAGQALADGLPTRMQGAARDLRDTAEALRGAAQRWWLTQRAAARALLDNVRAELPHTGDRRDLLASGVQRLDDALTNLPPLPFIPAIGQRLDDAARDPQRLTGDLDRLDKLMQRAVGVPAELTGDGPAPVGGMAGLTAAMTELRAAFHDTPWVRAGALLGAGRAGFSAPDVTAVMQLADRLRLSPRQVSAPAGLADRVRAAVTRRAVSGQQTDAELFTWLAGQIGLHRRLAASPGTQGPDLPRLFRLLSLAIELYGREPIGLDTLRSLRRLADLLLAQAGLVIGSTNRQIIANLAGELRHVLPAELTGPAVAPDQQVLALVQMVAQAEQAKQPGGRVTRDDLSALAVARQHVQQAHAYLKATQDPTPAEKAQLVDQLLRGLPTDDALRAALDLLHASDPAELTRLFRSGRLAERLLARIPTGHQLHGELSRFVAQRFGAGVRPGLLLSSGAPHGGGRPVRIPLQERPFRPELISPALAGVVLPPDAAPQRSGPATRPRPRPATRPSPRPVMLSKADYAFLHAVRSVDEYLAGGEELTVSRKAELLDQLLSGPRSFLEPLLDEFLAPGRDPVPQLKKALDLLHASDPAELTQLFRSGRLAERLLARIPAGHQLHGELSRFVAQRFGAGVRPGLLLSSGTRHGGGTPVRIPLQERPFRPELISSALAGVKVKSRLTRAQLDEAIAGIGQRTDLAVIRGLGLSGDERLTAEQWLARLRAAAARDKALRGHFGGDAARQLTPRRLLELLKEALTGLAPVQGLEQLEALDGTQLLQVITEQGGLPELRDLLVQTIPQADALRLRAYQFLDNRFDSDGRVIPNVRPQPYGLSRPAQARADTGQHSFLTREQLTQAAAAVRPFSDVEIARRLGLSADERELATGWLAGLRKAIGREDQIRGYLSCNPDAGLIGSQQRQTAQGALRGLAPWQALDLMNAADDDQLIEMTQDGNLLRLAREHLHQGHPLRPELDLLLARRFSGDTVVLGVQPRRPFTLALVDYRLRDIDVSTQPTHDQMLSIARETVGRADVLSGLPPMPPVELARARWWAEHVAEPARLVQQAQDYLDGNLDARPELPQLRQLITDLLRTVRTRYQAVELVRPLADHQLAGLNENGALQAALTQAIPEGDHLRPDLNEVLDERFDKNGQVKPVHPAQETFRPNLIVSSLARGTSDELTTADLLTIAATLQGRPADELVGALRLPPVELARARWWLGSAREAMREWVLNHLAGNPAFRLPARDQELLIPELMALPDDRGAEPVRALLTANDAIELRDLAERAERARRAQQPALHNALSRFVGDRVEMGGQKPSPAPWGFKPSMIDKGLVNLGLDDQLDWEQLSNLTYAVEELGDEGLEELLSWLPPKQRARAEWWLADVRVQLDNLIRELEGDPSTEETAEHLNEGMLAIDRQLSRYYSSVARGIPDPRTLTGLAAVPPDTQVQRLREALSPPGLIEGADEGPADFVDRLRDETEPFRVKLAREMRDLLEEDYQDIVTGHGEAEHDAEDALYSWDHVGRIARLASEWINEVFGSMAGVADQEPRIAEPGEPGNMYDHFDYVRWQMSTMKGPELVDIARKMLGSNLMMAESIVGLLKRHNADPHYGPDSEPLNEIANVVDDAIEALVADENVVQQALEVRRGWDGRTLPQQQKILVQRFKAETPEENREKLRDLAQTIIHEILHLRENPEYTVFSQPMPGEHERNTLIEGVVSLLTEVVWSHVKAKLTADPAELERVLRIVDGEYYDENADEEWPDPAIVQRYPSHAEAMRLVRQVGIQNLYAAFFGGATQMITGRRPGDRRSLLAPGGTAAAHPRPASLLLPSRRSSGLLPPWTPSTQSPVSPLPDTAPDDLFGASMLRAESPEPPQPVTQPPVVRAPAPPARRPAIPPAQPPQVAPPAPAPAERPPTAAQPPVPPAQRPVRPPARPPTGAEQVDAWLKDQGLTRVSVPADGDCTYHGLIEVAGEHLAQLFGRTPVPMDLRRYLADILSREQAWEVAGQPTRYGGYIQEDPRRPGQTRGEAWAQHIDWITSIDGRWGNDAADVVLNLMAFEFGLPLTVVQPGHSRPQVNDIGPDGPHRYALVLHGEHYWPTRPQPGQPQPHPIDTDVRGEIDRLRDQFGWLQSRYAELLVGDRGNGEDEVRAAGYAADFNEILTQQRPEGSRQPDPAFQQQRLQRLRHSHRAWLSAVRNSFPRIAPSEDAAHLTLGELQAHQQAPLAPAAGPSSQPAAGRGPAAVPQAPGEAPPTGLGDTPFGPMVRQPRRRPGEGPTGVSTQRLGDQLHVLRRRVLTYLGRPGAPTAPVQDAVEQLTAVLAEAVGQAGDEPREPEWNALVSGGLARLFPPTSDRSYTAHLPGIDPATLGEGDRVTVTGLIHAHTDAGSIPGGDVRYEIVSPRGGRDVAALVGDASDLVLFDRGQRFQVTYITADRHDRWLIQLQHLVSRPSAAPDERVDSGSRTPPATTRDIHRPTSAPQPPPPALTPGPPAPPAPSRRDGAPTGLPQARLGDAPSATGRSSPERVSDQPSTHLLPANLDSSPSAADSAGPPSARSVSQQPGPPPAHLATSERTTPKSGEPTAPAQLTVPVQTASGVPGPDRPRDGLTVQPRTPAPKSPAAAHQAVPQSPSVAPPTPVPHSGSAAEGAVRELGVPSGSDAAGQRMGHTPAIGGFAPLQPLADRRPDVRTVIMPSDGQTVDLQPVRDLLRRERALGPSLRTCPMANAVKLCSTSSGGSSPGRGGRRSRPHQGIESSLSTAISSSSTSSVNPAGGRGWDRTGRPGPSGTGPLSTGTWAGI